VSQCAPRRKGADTLVHGTGGSKLRASQCSSFLATTHAATCGSIHWYGCAGSRGSAAVLVVYFGFDFDLPIWSCLGVMKIRYRPTVCVGSTSSAFVELCGRNVSETARRLNIHRRTLQRILAMRAPR
jgi:hypothetical protein